MFVSGLLWLEVGVDVGFCCGVEGTVWRETKKNTNYWMFNENK